jgi:hypothetical protein
LQAAVNGARDKNPFHFENMDMSEIYLTHNNRPIPTQPFRPNFKEGEFYRMYSHYFDNIGIYHSDYGNEVTEEAFANGMTLIPFDLTPGKIM